MTDRRVTLGVCAALVAGSWAVCAWVYHANGGGSYNAGFFGLLVAVAAVATVASVALIVRASRAGGRLFGPLAVSLIAALAVLLLAVAIYARD